MTRQAHHRADNRTGPHHSWLRKKTYHLLKVMRPGFVSLRLLATARPAGNGLWHLDAAVMLELRRALDDFRPYAEDTDGKAWE